MFLSTAYIGKVAQASQIAKTWRQSQRFARLDPEHRYGVYVVRAPEFIRLDRAVATAQGEDELKKCTRSFRALGPDMDTAIAIASATQSATQSASASSSGFASSIVNWTGIDDQVLPAAADAAAATRVARARTIVPSATQAGDAAKGASLGAGAEEVAGNGGSGGSGGSGVIAEQAAVQSRVVAEAVFENAAGGNLDRAMTALYKVAAAPSVVAVRAYMRAFSRLVEGLVTYHDGGLVHRDIKPANCVLQAGTWRLPMAFRYIDFDEGMSVEEVARGGGDATGTPYFLPTLQRILGLRGLAAGFPTVAQAGDAASVEYVAQTAAIQCADWDALDTSSGGGGARALPSWLATPSEVVALMRCALANVVDVAKRARSRDAPRFFASLPPTATAPAAVAVASLVYADTYALCAVSLAKLWYVLTRTRFVAPALRPPSKPAGSRELDMRDARDAVPMRTDVVLLDLDSAEAAQFVALNARLGAAHAAVGALVLDASRANVWPVTLKARFEEVLAALS